jgi:hypothetical protein
MRGHLSNGRNVTQSLQKMPLRRSSRTSRQSAERLSTVERMGCILVISAPLSSSDPRRHQDGRGVGVGRAPANQAESRRMRPRVLTFFTSTVFTVAVFMPACAGQLEDANAALKRGDLTTGLRLLVPLTRQGNAAAEYRMGDLYDLGAINLDLPHDSDKAFYWFRRAADHGSQDAALRLGGMYERAENYKLAVYWYGQAAQHGNQSAELSLGLMYADGKGVDQNFEQSAYWFDKAAQQGEPFAQEELSEFYADGRGVPQNYLRAYFWGGHFGCAAG